MHISDFTAPVELAKNAKEYRKADTYRSARRLFGRALYRKAKPELRKMRSVSFVPPNNKVSIIKSMRK